MLVSHLSWESQASPHRPCNARMSLYSEKKAKALSCHEVGGEEAMLLGALH